MIEEHLALPFETLVLGVRVTVDAVDLSQDDRIVAIWGTLYLISPT
jgi:hypothetical protein